MTAPTQKPAPTVADYKAAEERLRQVRNEAAAGVKDAQERGDVAKGSEWILKAQKEFDAFKAFREGVPRDVLLSIHADRILDGFSIETEHGWKAKIGSLFGRAPTRTVSLVIPPAISDEDAVHALNARFREMFPAKGRAAIYEPDIEKILDAGYGCGRLSHAPRIIRLIGVVPGTTRKTRDQQAEALQEKGLKFPHPIEQALAAAAYACARNGKDLFKNALVRGSVPPVALYTYPFKGVCVQWFDDDVVERVLAASGSPSSLSAPSGLRRDGSESK